MDDLEDASSTNTLGNDPRRQTLAFRLTEAERRSIDALAASDGIRISEFARRAVLGGLGTRLADIEHAREQGRADMGPQIAELESELAETKERAADAQREVRDLQARLQGAPDELLAAVRYLLAGSLGAKERVARCWSRLGIATRSEFIPTVAAALSNEVDQSLARFHVDEAGVDAAVDLVNRLRWLKDALTTQSGRRLYSPTREELFRAPEPLEAVYSDALQRVAHRIQCLKEYEEKRSSRTAVTALDTDETP